MPLDMNPEIRARWAAALRSGDYEQTSGSLSDGQAFCCLGVLCDLAARDKVIPPLVADGKPVYGEDTDEELPYRVRAWAGINASNPKVIAEVQGDVEQVPLIGLNDDYHWSFAQIADAIDGGAASSEGSQQS